MSAAEAARGEEKVPDAEVQPIEDVCSCAWSEQSKRDGPERKTRDLPGVICRRLERVRERESGRRVAVV
jgi:hypothetical protein